MFLLCSSFSNRELSFFFFRGYVFTAPKRFLAGETESGCLSLHNLEPPAHVLLELLSPSSSGAEDEVLARTSGVVETGKRKSFSSPSRFLRSIEDLSCFKIGRNFFFEEDKNREDLIFFYFCV